MGSKRRTWRAALALLACLALAAPAAASPPRRLLGLDGAGVLERAWELVMRTWSAVRGETGSPSIRARTARHGGAIDPNGQPSGAADGADGSAGAQGDQGLTIDPNG